MKNSAKSNKNNLEPTIKKKTIDKKNKDKSKNKNVKELINNDFVQLDEQNHLLINDKIKDKSIKQKKTETKTPKTKKSKKLTNDVQQSNKKTNEKSSKIVNKQSSSSLNKSSINKKINKSKDDKKSTKPTPKSTKNSNNNSKIRNEDKKLAALLQLQEMRPRQSRLASLNASCKMQLLYESEREKINDHQIVLNNTNEVDDETDVSTEEVDPIESIIRETIKLNSSDLLTEDEEEKSDIESDHEEKPIVIKEEVKIKSNKKKNSNKQILNLVKEYDLLSESINSVVNSFNEEYKNEKKKDTSKLDKKKKFEKDNNDSKDKNIIKDKEKDNKDGSKDNNKDSKDKSINKKLKSTTTNKQSKDNQKSINSSKTKDKQQDSKSQKTTVKDKKEKKLTPSSNKKDKNNSTKKTKNALVKENDKKRKLIDDSIELIDTRSTKRLASLNASAIMAASYQDEKLLPPIQQTNDESIKEQSSTQPQSPKSNYEEKHVEVIHKTTTVVNNEVTETIEMFKKVQHVSGKIRDRLLAIEMMEKDEHTDEEELNSSHCIIEEPETEDEQEDAKNVSGNDGKSVLQKKINALSLSKQQNNKSVNGGSEVIEELNNDDLRHKKIPKSTYVTSSSTSNGDTTVTSITKTTKYKINKKKSDKTSSSFNPLAVDNLRANSEQQFDKSSNVNTEQNTNNLNNNHQAAAGAQFVPLANPYGIQSTPGYCIYPSNATAALQAAVAYQQQLAQQQLAQQQFAYQQLQQVNLLQQQFPTMPVHQPAETVSQQQQQQSSSLNLSNSNNNSTNSTSSSTKQSYKSAFNAVPHNSAASTTSNTKTTNVSSSSTSSSKSNGVYQSQNNTANDSSYLIHKPLAFNAATGNPIFSSTNNPGAAIQLNQLAQLKTQQPSQINNIIHPAAQQTTNLLTQHAAQASSLVPAMQYFQHNNAALAGSPYILQYPQAPDLGAQLNPLTAFHQSQTQPQYSASAFGTPNQFNIALIPGQNTPFLNAAANQQLAAQTPMFINPILNPLNSISAVQPFTTAVPSSTNGILVGSALNILKDSIIIKTTNDFNPIIATNETKNVKEKNLKSKNKNKPKETSIVNIISPGQQNSTILITQPTLKPMTLNVSHLPINLNNNINDKSNTITTTSTETIPSVIKIKPSNLIATTTTTTNDSAKSNIKTMTMKNSNKQLNGVNNSIKSKSLATGIRKREKKLSISTNQMNKVIKVNNLNTTKTIMTSAGKSDQQIQNKITINSNNQKMNDSQKLVKTMITSMQQNKRKNPFLTDPKKEPLSLKSNSTNNGLDNTVNLVLLNNSSQQSNKQKNSLTIFVNNKESNGLKSNNQNDQLKVVSNKKLKIDLNSNSSPKSNQQQSTKNAITITPIALNNNISSSAISLKNSSNKEYSSLNAVQLDTASMRTNNIKKTSSTNMLNQTGKSFAIHPSNFYSNNAVNFNSSVITTNKKQTELQNNQHLNNLNPFKINDVNLENYLNETSMKGLNRKTNKNNQIKQNEVIDQNKLLLSHNWKWLGEPVKKMIYISDNNNQLRDTYTQMKHIEGEIINTGDCVLLRSGPKPNDVPFVAKIAALYEDPQTKAMMMMIFWFYRPEHTDIVISKSNNWSSEEIFASKHRDVNSVACIDDRCFVLTLNEYCRYKKKQKMTALNIDQSLTDQIVPKSKEPYSRLNRLPPETAQDVSVFCCRKVYDSRNKRILKNPS